jgi:sugar phosphate isomerase/epimerase
MKLTLTTSTDPVELKTFLDYCSRMGQNAVDLFNTWVPIDTLQSARRDLDTRGIKPVSISAVALTSGPDAVEEAVGTIREAMVIAGELSAELVNIAIGMRARLSTDQQIEAYARTIAPCLDEAERLGLTILLENRWDWFGDDTDHSEITRRAEWIARLIERVDSPRFRSTFDAGNFVTVGEEPYPHAYEILKDVIGYVHVKDATLYHPKRHGARIVASRTKTSFTDLTDTGVHIWADGKLGGSDREFVFTPLGEGAVNWEGLLRALKQDGYTGWFQVEPHAYPLFGDSHDRATRQALEYLRRSSWFE